jgi:hypothetical protein
MGYLHQLLSAAPASSAAGHTAEHGPAVVGLLYLPVVLMALLVGAQAVAQRGVPAARRFLEGLDALQPALRLVLLLLLVSATVHLSLAPVHAEEPVTAALFVADAVVEVAICAAACLLSLPWRPLAAAILAANLLAYALYVVAGLESVEAVGLATKLVEGMALALVMSVGEVSYRGARR